MKEGFAYLLEPVFPQTAFEINQQLQTVQFIIIILDGYNVSVTLHT